MWHVNSFSERQERTHAGLHVCKQKREKEEPKAFCTPVSPVKPVPPVGPVLPVSPVTPVGPGPANRVIITSVSNIWPCMDTLHASRSLGPTTSLS